MELVEVLAFPGPSLVAPERCLSARLRVNSSDHGVLSEHQRTLLSGVNFFTEIDLASLAGNLEPGVPFFVGLVAELARYFLASAGAGTSGPWTHCIENGREYQVALGHDNGALAEFALRQAFLAAAGLYPSPVQVIFPPGIRDLDAERVWQEFRAAAPNLRKSVQVKLLTTACRQRGIPWIPLDRYPGSRNLIQIGYGRFQRLIRVTITDHQSHLGAEIAGSKYQTALFLRDVGFPVPTQRLVRSGYDAREAAEAIGYPVVVKPERGGKGKGVHVRLTDASQVHHAVKAIGRLYQQYNVPVVVEEWVPGNDYRLLVAGGHFISATRRIPAQVCGDGRHSIAELIEIANATPLRGDGVTTHLVRLQLGDTELAQLRAQGFHEDTVLEEDQVAILRGTANLATGGTLQAVTEKIHPHNRELAVRVAAALNGDILGLDVVCQDIGVSFLEAPLKIIEVNVGAGVQATPAPDGSGQEVRAGEIIDLLFPADQRCTVPIITVTGGAEAARVSDFVAQGLTTGGYAVGLASRDGLAVKNAPWATPDNVDTRDSAFQLLRNREIDAVVVERSYDVLQRWGVGTGGCDIAILLGGTDHILEADATQGTGSADRLAAMLIESARVATVVYLDEDYSLRIAATAPAGRLCVVSQHGLSATVQRYVAGGARAVVLETTAEKEVRLITIARSEKSEIILDLPPVSKEEERFADLLPAFAACFCLGCSPAGLLSLLGSRQGVV